MVMVSFKKKSFNKVICCAELHFNIPKISIDIYAFICILCLYYVCYMRGYLVRVTI